MDKRTAKSPRGRPPTLGEADYDHSDAEGTPSAAPVQQGNDNVMGIAIGDAAAVMPRAAGAKTIQKRDKATRLRSILRTANALWLPSRRSRRAPPPRLIF